MRTSLATIVCQVENYTSGYICIYKLIPHNDQQKEKEMFLKFPKDNLAYTSKENLPYQNGSN